MADISDIIQKQERGRMVGQNTSAAFKTTDGQRVSPAGYRT